jgi:hypothetical protein
MHTQRGDEGPGLTAFRRFYCKAAEVWLIIIPSHPHKIIQPSFPRSQEHRWAACEPGKSMDGAADNRCDRTLQCTCWLQIMADRQVPARPPHTQPTPPEDYDQHRQPPGAPHGAHWCRGGRRRPPLCRAARLRPCCADGGRSPARLSRRCAATAALCMHSAPPGPCTAAGALSPGASGGHAAAAPASSADARPAPLARPGPPARGAPRAARRACGRRMRSARTTRSSHLRRC